MIFKINKEYSNKTIGKHSKNISIEGQFEGGKHTIHTETNKFIMLVEGAWRGANSIYYKCVN